MADLDAATCWNVFGDVERAPSVRARPTLRGASVGQVRATAFSLTKALKMIKNSDLPALEEMALPYLVERDWLERLCTLNVLADHGDLDASDTLRAWCAHDPEAREVRVALTTALRAVQLFDDR